MQIGGQRPGRWTDGLNFLSQSRTTQTHARSTKVEGSFMYNSEICRFSLQGVSWDYYAYAEWINFCCTGKNSDSKGWNVDPENACLYFVWSLCLGSSCSKKPKIPRWNHHNIFILHPSIGKFCMT